MDKQVRELFIKSLVGLPWKANAKGPDAYDCWHLAVHIEDVMFERKAPEIKVPEHPTWPWLIEQFKSHAELANWVEILQPNNGLTVASDGAIVLMARSKHPAHCGVYLKQEKAVIHCDENQGVVFQDLLTLRNNSWAKLRFFEPR